jgi:hypothetical protein
VTAQAAVEVLSLSGPREGRVRARLRLACGCTVERELPEDRLLERQGGAPFVVGKYPCPVGHPAGHRPG